LVFLAVHYETAGEMTPPSLPQKRHWFSRFLPAGGIWQIRAGLHVRPFAQTIVGRAGWLGGRIEGNIIEVSVGERLEFLTGAREQIVGGALAKAAIWRTV